MNDQTGPALSALSLAVSAVIDAAQADREAYAQALGQANIALSQSQAQVADLQKQLDALRAASDPWASVDKTGKIDVTDQVQALVDAGHNIPAGRFLIDLTKSVIFNKSCDGAVDADGMPATFLIGKPSATPKDCVYEVRGAGITVRNIRSTGDRMAQLYTPGTTNEWGYGGKVTGAGSTIENCISELCTGDGYGITAPNVTVKNCRSDRNRRNNLSGFNCPGLKIIGGAYTNAGAVTVDGVTDAGAQYGPWAGIDIEPDAPKPGQPAPTVDVLIDGATITGNKGAGVESWLRSEVGGSLDITIKNCHIADSPNLVLGKALAGSVSLTVVRNTFSGSRKANLRAETGCTAKVGTAAAADANTSTGLAQKYALQAVGTPPGVIVAGVNTYA